MNVELIDAAWGERRQMDLVTRADRRTRALGFSRNCVLPRVVQRQPVRVGADHADRHRDVALRVGAITCQFILGINVVAHFVD